MPTSPSSSLSWLLCRAQYSLYRAQYSLAGLPLMTTSSRTVPHRHKGQHDRFSQSVRHAASLRHLVMIVRQLAGQMVSFGNLGKLSSVHTLAAVLLALPVR